MDKLNDELEKNTHNLIIGDSLINRSIRHGILPWFEHTIFKKYNNKYDSESSRTTKYLYHLKLSKSYKNIFIHLGIVDAAPRVTDIDMYLLKPSKIPIKKLPSKKKLKAIGVDPNITYNDYIKYCKKNRQLVLKNHYNKFKYNMSYFSPDRYKRNIAKFIDVNKNKFEKLYLISILPYHEEFEKIKGYKTFEHLEKYNTMLKYLSTRYENVHYIDIVDLFNKSDHNLNDCIFLGTKKKLDGHHLHEDKFEIFSNVFNIYFNNNSIYKNEG